MIGILCGLEQEARIARRVKGSRVAVSAADPVQARRAVEELVAAGCTSLMSFGLAGALSPHQVAGDCILGRDVISAHGRWTTDPHWREVIRQNNPFAHERDVWGQDGIVDSAAAKAALYAQTKAAIVDTESHIVAERAAAYRLPFVVVRAVADQADQALPPAALLPLNRDGSPNLGGVFGNLLRRPGQIGALMQLGLRTSKAMDSLALYRLDGVS